MYGSVVALFSKNIGRIIYTYLMLFIIMVSPLHNNNISAAVYSYGENELKTKIEKIYNERSSAFVTGDIAHLEQYFDTSQKQSKQALEHEIKRVKYLKNWSNQRGIKFKDINSTIRIKSIRSIGAIVKIDLEETYRFDYVYPADLEEIVNSFGIGMRHKLELIKKENVWMVRSDSYTDCFEDSLTTYTGDINTNAISFNDQLDFEKAVNAVNLTNMGYYDREKALAYAEIYCGAAWGNVNGFNYNSKYKDYTGIGGDCTNFISQVLGDAEGGGIPFSKEWYCNYSNSDNNQGSIAWVNANRLKKYLLSSGRGTIVKYGNYNELAAPSPRNPLGDIGKLKLGDLICYEKDNGTVDHFAIITGYDSNGYTLVNSHTTDRNHVPWDLGWGDNRIRFCLIHIND